MEGDLAGRVVIVALGAPIAAALAKRLATAGATVVLVGRDGAQAGDLLADIEAAGSGRGAFFHLGEETDDDLEALAYFVAEQFTR